MDAGDGAGGQAGQTGVTIVGDASLLRHLVRNLLENAVRHGSGPAGAEVRASVAVRAPASVAPPSRGATPSAAVRAPVASSIVISVEDDGPGIPAGEEERIFAPFYRAPTAPGVTAPPPGHGLGLALVRQVARYHGGEARYLPRPGGGSRFEVTLPAPASATGVRERIGRHDHVAAHDLFQLDERAVRVASRHVTSRRGARHARDRLE